MEIEESISHFLADEKTKINDLNQLHHRQNEEDDEREHEQQQQEEEEVEEQQQQQLQIDMKRKEENKNVKQLNEQERQQKQNLHNEEQQQKQQKSDQQKQQESDQQKQQISVQQEQQKQDNQQKEKQEEQLKKNEHSNNVLSYVKIVKLPMLDEIFCNRRVCLMNTTNSITCSNYGLSKVLMYNYPYADIVAKREMEPSLKIAKKQFRSAPGTVEIRQDVEKNLCSPAIATLVCQYGIGKPFEDNLIAQYIVNRTYDLQHKRCLRDDTSQNRLTMFDNGMRKFSELIRSSEFNHIKLVVFPIGFGNRGMVDDHWIKFYLPLIADMFRYLRSIDKIGCLSFPPHSEANLNNMENNKGARYAEYLNYFNEMSESDILCNTCHDIDGEQVVFTN